MPKTHKNDDAARFASAIDVRPIDAAKSVLNEMLPTNRDMDHAGKQPESAPLSLSGSRSGTRAPHVATGAVVEQQGHESARELYAAFGEYNARFFGGKLGAPLILITQAQSPRTLGDYIARDLLGLESRIRISPAVVRCGTLFAADVLLHEMIHAWQAEIAFDGERGYRGHGPKFARECNRIGEALALPPVGVKGRDGLPDCAHWPLCVRPDGYYPQPFQRPRRKKISTPKELLEAMIAALPRLEDEQLRALATAVADEINSRAVA